MRREIWAQVTSGMVVSEEVITRGQNDVQCGREGRVTYQEGAVLIPPIVHPKPLQLRVHIEVQERAVRCGRDIIIQIPVVVRHGAIAAVVRVPTDISRFRDVKDVNMPIDGERLVLPVPEAAITGEHKELTVGQGMNFGLRGNFGVLGGLGRIVVVEGERYHILGDVNGCQLVRDVVGYQTGVLFCL